MTRTLRSLAVPALALALAAGAAACAPGGPQLAGHAYLSTAITEGGAPRQLVAGTRIRLDFTGTNLGASAGCNSIGGTYRIDGGRLIFEGVAMTEMGCDPQRHAQDDWLVAFLTSKPSIRLAGNDLTLESATTAIRLLDREVAEPDLNLVGPTWTVESIISGDTVASVPQGATATLVFRADGTLDVDAGCNRGGGTWVLEGGGVRISQVALTKMACDGPRAQLEAAVMGVLNAGSLSATIDASVLTLGAGASGLQLRGS